MNTKKRATELLKFIDWLDQNGKAQGKELSFFLKLAFYTGIRKNELLKLKVDDLVNTKWQAHDEIVTKKNRRYLLSNDVKTYIEKFLQDKNYLNSSAFIFDRYRHPIYIDRDISNFNKSFSFSEIKRLSINYHYEELLKDKNLNDRIEIISEIFNLSSRHVNDVIKKRIQPAGKQKETDYDLLIELMKMSEVLSKKNIDADKESRLQYIKEKLMNNPKFSQSAEILFNDLEKKGIKI